jgi:uncharacterized membrane protein
MTKTHPRRTRQIIRSFEAQALRKRGFGAKVANALTSFFGSIWFLLLNLFIFVVWVMANTGRIPGIPIFDPYPYVLLITFVSLEAIVLTVIVLMSQNRQSQIGTLRDELQLQVELITEKEITKVLQLLKKILQKHEITISDAELDEMLEVIDRSYIEKKLEEQLIGKQESVAKKFENTLIPKK